MTGPFTTSIIIIIKIIIQRTVGLIMMIIRICTSS